MEKLSESNPSNRDYRLKLAFEFAPGLAHVYASLRSLRSVAAIPVSISQASMFSHPTFLRLLCLLAAIPVLSQRVCLCHVRTIGTSRCSSLSRWVLS
jgi:hypothetical protein